MTTTAALSLTAANGTITLTITDWDNATTEIHSVKDGQNALRNIDRKLSDLMWNRSALTADMTATLTRPATYTLLTKLNG